MYVIIDDNLYILRLKNLEGIDFETSILICCMFQSATIEEQSDQGLQVSFLTKPIVNI